MCVEMVLVLMKKEGMYDVDIAMTSLKYYKDVLNLAYLMLN